MPDGYATHIALRIVTPPHRAHPARVELLIE